MPPFQRSFNPYTSAPPPPASYPDYEIRKDTIQLLTDEEAGAKIDFFLQNQDGKILTLHRLADHLLGRTQALADGDLEELGHVLEEERQREAGTVHFINEDIKDLEEEEEEEEATEEIDHVPNIEVDKRKARKEERRIKKEKKRKKRMEEAQVQQDDDIQVRSSKKSKKKHHKS